MLAKGRKLVVTGAGISKNDYEYTEEAQTIYIRNSNTSPGHVHHIRVELDPPLNTVIEFTTHWWDFKFIYSIIVILIAVLVTYLTI